MTNCIIYSLQLHQLEMTVYLFIFIYLFNGDERQARA